MGEKKKCIYVFLNVHKIDSVIGIANNFSVNINIRKKTYNWATWSFTEYLYEICYKLISANKCAYSNGPLIKLGIYISKHLLAELL